MKLGYAKQYQKSCIILEPEDELDDVIHMAELENAIFYEGPDLTLDKTYVVQFPGRPKELYTKRALRGSLPIS